MMHVSQHRRRATVLLMVVSLLALLFVIVTGFLAVARFQEQLQTEVRKGDVRRQIVKSTEEIVIGHFVDSIRGDHGVLGGDPMTSPETIPGYRFNPVLGSIEPVWDEDFVPAQNGFDFASPNSRRALVDFSKLVWPSVLSFGASNEKSPEPHSVLLLMPENELDKDVKYSLGDLAFIARNGWLDADGDGVPDTDLALAALLTEAANAAEGTIVAVPSFDRVTPADIDGANQSGVPKSAIFATQAPTIGRDEQGQTWRRFLDSARYVVAGRSVAHGGMIALDAPLVSTPAGQVVPWNRRFLTELFDRLRHPNDAGFLSRANKGDLDDFFAEIEASRNLVETSLRSRLLLPAASPSALPPVLAKLEGYEPGRFQFPATFVPEFPSRGHTGARWSVRQNGELWQRFNLADDRDLDLNERTAWARAVARRPAEYDDARDAREHNDDAYSRRQLLTTINNSDLLARKQNPAEPPLTNPSALNTYRGELKYYLGEVNKAYDQVGNGWQYNSAAGDVVIGQLARLYRDMLDSHYDPAAPSMWPVATGAPTPGSGNQAVSISQQAYMLAVNTVAFASPRDFGAPTAGWIDNVVYSSGPGTFVGYSPQPFLTEAIASRLNLDDDGSGGGSARTAIALGVEIFNPQDFSYELGNPQQDTFALNLDQYRIRLATGVRNAPWDSLPLSTVALGSGGVTPQRPLANRMNGRTFLTMSMEESADNDLFSANAIDQIDGTNSLGGTPGQPNFDTVQPTITVQLQRQSKSGGWFTVDQMTLTMPTGQRFSFETRDTYPARIFGPADLNVDGLPDDVNGDGLAEPYARWNVATARGADERNGIPATTTLGNETYLGPNAGIKHPDGTAYVPSMPMTPLITMNAAPGNDLLMFGNPDDLRPRSFPTVGFLLFVPRFSHYSTAAGAIPMSATLGKQWLNQMGSGIPAYKVLADGTKSIGQTLIANYPVDFGHMPVYDNSTPVRLGSYLSKVSGETVNPISGAAQVGVGLPWGQLVFDYFTTLNPHAEDVDPYRVPGRIDINTAPWNLLTELPLMGPFAAYNQLFPSVTTSNELPLRWYASAPTTNQPAVTLLDPSPSFWDPFVGVLCGMSSEVVDPVEGTNFDRRSRLFHGSVPGVSVGGRMWPEYDGLNTLNNGQYRLGGWLAEAAASYRDGIRYIANSMSGSRYRFSQLRGGFGADSTGGTVRPPYRNGALYAPTLPGILPINLPGGGIRGADDGTPDDGRPEDFGFITLGELLNVQGFDSTLTLDIDNSVLSYPYVAPLLEYQLRNTTLARGDFVKSVSLMALLDTQVLTTRSNTFTVYASVIDRQDPSSSIRTQVTIDRSNLLPRLQYFDAKLMGTSQRPTVPKLVSDGSGGAIPIQTFNDDAQPTVVTRKRAAYFNARYDN